MTESNVDTLTADGIAALRGLLEKATPGEWESLTHLGGGRHRVKGPTYAAKLPKCEGGYRWFSNQADAELIVALRNLAPALLAAAEAQTPRESLKQRNPCLKCGTWLWDDPRPCWNCKRLAAQATDEQVHDFAKTISDLFVALRDAPSFTGLTYEAYEEWVGDMQGKAADMLERMPQKAALPLPPAAPPQET